VALCVVSCIESNNYLPLLPHCCLNETLKIGPLICQALKLPSWEGRERKCSGCSQRQCVRFWYQSYWCKYRVNLLLLFGGILEQYKTVRFDPLSSNKTQKKRR